MSNDNWTLGQTSTRYETGGRGAGTISSGKGDRGGVSYGSYQLSSKMGTLQEYLDSSPYGKHFEGLTPTSREFNEKWRELARTDPNFAKDQHDFIKKTHYDVQVAKLEKAGIDLSDRGPAVQDALWSTSVQFRNLMQRIVTRGLEEKFGKGYDLSELSDKDIVEAIQDYKIKHNKQLFSKSPDLWESLERRAKNEKATLLELADRDIQIDRNPEKHEKVESQKQDKAESSSTLKEGTEGARVPNPLVSEATHQNHGLYTAIGQQLPAGTKADMAANFTLQAMENGIAKPADLRGVLVRGNDVTVVGNTPGFNAKVDLNAPTADLQAMSDHMAGQSRQATTQRAQEAALQQ